MHYGDVTIDIGDCGTGGTAAGREDILREGGTFPQHPHPRQSRDAQAWHQVRPRQRILQRITNYKESSVCYTIRVWVFKDDYWNIRFDLLENIKKEFDKEKITIPYNQLDVHIDKD